MLIRDALQFPSLPKGYADLCLLLTPRPMHYRADYRNVTEVTDPMALWQDDFTPDDKDYFDLLCGLVGGLRPGPCALAQAERACMVSAPAAGSRFAAADLSRVLGGSRNLSTMILRRGRNLTVADIRKLADHSQVSPELLV